MTKDSKVLFLTKTNQLKMTQTPKTVVQMGFISVTVFLKKQKKKKKQQRSSFCTKPLKMNKMVLKKIQFYLCPRGNTNTSRLQLEQISKDRAK